VSLRLRFLCRAVTTLVLAGVVPGQTELPSVVRQLCGECHRGADAEAGLDLDALFAAPVGAREERAALAVQRLRSRTMPPPEATPVEASERQQAIAAFAALVPVARAARVATVRRLTRRQYERTIHELTGLQWDGQGLLPDDARAHGFDTNGDVTAVTPAQFEAYATAAATIADRVLATPAARQRVFGTGELLAGLPDLLARGFRRPPTAAELAARTTLWMQQLAADDGGTDVAARAVLQSILLSPAFLFRAEHGRPDAPHLLSAHEVADRLAYMLLGSMPDPALRTAADSGALDTAAGIAAQARRLLAASGARPFAEEFAGQWLRVRDVLATNADFRRYPQIWHGGLRPALLEEALRLFQAIVADDLPVTRLLDADFTFVNASLAAHYGLPGIEGDEFRRVTWPDARRGGVLSLGAVLLVTSYPLRTSPVLRGKWILDVLLDAPTPPPPPDAGALPADDVPVESLSLRQRLERHRRQSRCASCHAQLDPPGFALENFDVLGRWRDTLHEQPIDATGTLADGTTMQGLPGLRAALLARRDDFVRALVGKLLTYAVGRPMTLADEAELQRLVAASHAGGDRFGALLDAVVTSPLFTWRDPGGP
jgi:hypothetical protein